MKILVTSILDLETSAFNRVHHFVDYLSKNHEVTVISICDHWKSEHEAVAGDTHPDNFVMNHPNVTFKHYTDKKYSPIVQEVLSSLHIKSVLKDLDLNSFDCHYNYNGLCGGYAINKYVKKFNVPTIFDIADNLPAMIRTSPQLPKLLRIAGGIYGDILFKKNIKKSEIMTVTTKGLGKASGVPEEKMVILPNGVDTNLFYLHNRDEMRNKLHLGSSFVIGYVGVLREWVDFEPLFAAVEKLIKDIDIKVLIVGNGPNKENTENLAKKYNIESNTIFTGTIPYEQVPEYVSAMDVCSIPFKTDKVAKDSLPLKVFEYMACERPVISSKIDAIVEDMSDYVLCAETPDEYVDAISRYYENPDFRISLGKKGKQFVSENYTWDSISKKLENNIKEAKK